MLTEGCELMILWKEDVGANQAPITAAKDCSDSPLAAVCFCFAALSNQCSQQTGIPHCSRFHGKMYYKCC